MKKTRLIIKDAIYYIDIVFNDFDFFLNNDSVKQIIIDRLKYCCTKYNCILYSYSVTSKKIKLVIRFKENELKRFMHSLNIGISLNIKKISQISGKLFKKRYTSLIVSEEYMFDICNYVNLYALRQGLTNRPGLYKYDSLGEILGLVPQGLTQRDVILDIFSPDKEEAEHLYFKHIICLDNEESVFNNITQNSVIGDKDFYNYCIDNSQNINTIDIENKICELKDIIKKKTGISGERILSPNYNNIAGKIFASILKNHTDIKIVNIGKMFDKDLKAISRYIVRFEKDVNLRPEFSMLYNSVRDEFLEKIR